MSKVVYVGLLAVGVALLTLTTACGTMGSNDGCGCSACSTGCGGCGGCGGCSGCGGCADKAGCSGCGGCGGCGGDAAGTSDAKHAMMLVKQHTKWTKTNSKQFRSKPHKAMITNWVNAIGAKTFRSGKGTFPAGSVIAKEGWKKGKLAMVFLMEKRGAGYDQSNSNWWYATVTAGGKVMNSGRVKGCVGCHSGADNDYVFGNP